MCILHTYVNWNMICWTLNRSLETATKINGDLTKNTIFVSFAWMDSIRSSLLWTTLTSACIMPNIVASLSSLPCNEYIGLPAELSINTWFGWQTQFVSFSCIVFIELAAQRKQNTDTLTLVPRARCAKLVFFRLILVEVAHLYSFDC